SRRGTRPVVGRERGAKLEHALRARRAEAALDRVGARWAHRGRLQPRTRLRGRPRSAGEVHLRVRGRDDPRLVAHRPARLVDRGRGCDRRRRQRRRLPRGHARPRPPLRDRLPQWPRPRVRLALAAGAARGRVRGPVDPGVARRGLDGWAFRGRLPVTVPGVWGIAFGAGGASGPRTTLFYAAGPHRWHGATEVDIHGVLGAIAPA